MILMSSHQSIRYLRQNQIEQTINRHLGLPFSLFNMEKQYENSTSLLYNMVNSSFESPEEQRHVAIYWIIHIILVSGVATTTAYTLVVLILEEIKGGQSSGNTHGTGSLAKFSRIAKIIVTLMTFIESAIPIGQELTTKFYDTPDHCYIIETAKVELFFWSVE
ncbi:uncharacterized protein LOC144428172 [Styela clava]